LYIWVGGTKYKVKVIAWYTAISDRSTAHKTWSKA
jgi:hypothetical protein